MTVVELFVACESVRCKYTYAFLDQEKVEDIAWPDELKNHQDKLIRKILETSHQTIKYRIQLE